MSEIDAGLTAGGELLLRDVSDTALWAAVFRAQESEREGALFIDPLAKRLAGTRGARIMEAVPHAADNSWAWVMRTWLFDQILADGVRRGVDLVINLAAGLDTRPYRMALPAGLTWVEADLPQIISYKEEVLADETPGCQVERVRIDLSDAAKRQDLFDSFLRNPRKTGAPRRSGSAEFLSCMAARESAPFALFRNSRKTGAPRRFSSAEFLLCLAARKNAPVALLGRNRRAMVLTEGLLIYLSDHDVSALAGELAAAGVDTWVLDIASPGLLAMMQETTGQATSKAGAAYRFAPATGPDFFLQHGWKASEVHSLFQAAVKTRRLPPELLPFENTPEPPQPWESGVWSGVCRLERM
jgi:O-methyltransferase involved in polyketide biosynthesis